MSDTLRSEHVDSTAWRDACSSAAGDGWRFSSLHAAAGEVRALFARAADQRLLTCTAQHGADGSPAVPTLVDLFPPAGWDEREAHDLHGIGFADHTPLRPLVRHSDDLAQWTVPVAGDDVHQVAVGPVHAGVTESGHFRFHVVGERIIHVDLRLFHKHRGLERAAEGLPVAAAIAYAQRACAACAVTNTVAYAQAAEQGLGLWPDAALTRERTLLLELERLYNHLNDIAAICAGVSFAAGGMAFQALKERAQRVNATLTGHRFLFGSIAVGEGRLGIDAALAHEARAELRSIQAQADRAWRAILFNGSVQERLDVVGVLEPEVARELGTVGPAGRASGCERDTRTHSPRLHYPGFVAARPSAPTGDVQRRLELRAAELPTTFAILDELLAGSLSPGGTQRDRDPVATGAALVESPRGETAAVLDLDPAGLVTRFHLRTGSYRNWPAVGHAAANNLLPDFPLINKSFELCYACADR